jgi:hypothetical protein
VLKMERERGREGLKEFFSLHSFLFPFFFLCFFFSLSLEDVRTVDPGSVPQLAVLLRPRLPRCLNPQTTTASAHHRPLHWKPQSCFAAVLQNYQGSRSIAAAWRAARHRHGRTWAHEERIRDGRVGRKRGGKSSCCCRQAQQRCTLTTEKSQERERERESVCVCVCEKERREKRERREEKREETSPTAK